MRRVNLLLAICATAIVAGTTAFATDTDPFGFTEDQYSSWGIVDAPYPYEGYDANGNYIDYGCFPVGNGLVFGHLGVDSDFNTLRGLTGPGYQTREDDGAWAVWKEGNWPDMRLVVRIGGGATFIIPMIEKENIFPEESTFPFESQSIQQLRGAAMVRVKQTNSYGTLYSLTYCLPNEPILIREFVFEPTGNYIMALSLIMQGLGESSPGALLKNGSNNLDLVVVSNGWNEGWVEEGRFELGFQSEDGSWINHNAVAVVLSTDDQPAEQRQIRENDLKSLRQQTYDHWQNWSAQNLQFDTGDVRLDDMMIQLPVIIETQRDYYSGSTSPMVSYHGCWVRDNNGPILTYLANGRFEVVKRILRYHRACCKKYGSSQMLVPLDMDLSDIEGWKPDENRGSGRPPGWPNSGPSGGSAPTQNEMGDAGVAPTRKTAGHLSGIGTKPEDWEGTPVEHAEVPSLIVLQHYWLWKAMHEAGLGDEADAFIAEAWAFISHNLFAMTFHPEYGVYFHGDETYTQGALYSTYDRVESGQIGYPNGYIPTQDYTSFDNTILHRAAAACLAEMGETLGSGDDVEDTNVLAAEIDEIVQNQFTAPEGYNYPAIATFTGQQWPYPFSNINYRPSWLDLPYGDVSWGNNFGFAKDLLWDFPEYKSTPFSSAFTGHHQGYRLNAVVNTGWGVDAQGVVAGMKFSATPEGAWCEILNNSTALPGEKGWIDKKTSFGSYDMPDFPQEEFQKFIEPVPIYGRVNRIRPWESGINYAALVNYLRKKDGMRSFTNCVYGENLDIQFASSTPDNTLLLTITKSHDWLEQVKLDSRFRSFSEDRITAWDAGLPFSVHDLRNALFVGANPTYSGMFAPETDTVESSGDHKDRPYRDEDSQARQPAPPKISIPYLYFDRGVMGGLDRRTMKDHDFWYGEEMTKLLADYEAAGGTVITPDTMQMRLAYDEVVELKLLVALFPNTFTHRMSQAEIENFHHEMAEWVAWYDNVAGSRVKLKLDFIQVNTLLNEQMSGPQGDNVYWMGHGEVEDMLIERGVKLDHYDNVCAFWGWNRDNGALPGGEKANQAYGGAAQGPGSDMEFLGKSKRTGYFGSAVLADKPDGISKNATHEFLHNLDAMLEMVNVPELSHPDQMSRQMETLLAEVPGGFEHLGYSDDDLRAMVEAELRDEIHYPWPTQLVYYKQGIERVKRAKYGELLKHFGERKKKTHRTKLYENYILPEGVETYQVAYREGDGLTRVQLDDTDFVNEDDQVWQGEVWAGYLVGETDSQPVQRYFEAQIDYPSHVSFTLGDEPAINPGLIELDTDEGLAGAEMWADLDGGRLNFLNLGGFEYTADLPMATGGEITATFHARKDGYVITPHPVQIEIKPPWELEASFGLSDRNMPQLTVLVNGLPGKYDVVGKAETKFNTVQQMLVEDGLLNNAAQTWTMRVMEGEAASVSIPPSTFETISRIPIEIKVTHLSGEKQPSYTHRLPGEGSIPAMLEHFDSEDLPGYIPRCRPITPKVDGELDEWTSEPSIILTPENGNIFSGEVESKADAAVVLWLGYDDDYFYVAGGVRDDMTPGNGTWDSDRINLCFDALTDSTEDTYPDGPVGHNAWSKDDFWVFLNPMLPEGPKSMRLGGERPSGGKNGFYGPVAGAKAVVINEDDGAYRFEWAIPLETLPYLSPKPNTFCGFTMFYSDYDEGLNEMMYVTDWGGSGGIEWRFWDCGLLYFE